MRTIKFRAWDGDKMLMSSNVGTQVFFDFWCMLLDKPLMQFTGLHDINGKEIYEGDIIKMKQIQGYGELLGYVVGSVREDDEHDWRWWVKIKDSLVFFHDKPEVIGNLYQNPELLK